jgi:hypothetical protein
MSANSCVYISMHAASVVNDVPGKTLKVPGVSTAGANGLTNNNNMNAANSAGIKIKTTGGIRHNVEPAATPATPLTHAAAAGAAASLNSVERNSSARRAVTDSGGLQHDEPTSRSEGPLSSISCNHKRDNSPCSDHPSPAKAQATPRSAAMAPSAGAKAKRIKGEKIKDTKMEDDSDAGSGSVSDDESISSSCSGSCSGSGSYDSDASTSDLDDSASTGSTSTAQHEMQEESVELHPDLEYAVIAHRKKGMLLSRLSEVSSRGTLSVVSSFLVVRLEFGLAFSGSSACDCLIGAVLSLRFLWRYIHD